MDVRMQPGRRKIPEAGITDRVSCCWPNGVGCGQRGEFLKSAGTPRLPRPARGSPILMGYPAPSQRISRASRSRGSWDAMRRAIRDADSPKNRRSPRWFVANRGVPRTLQEFARWRIPRVRQQQETRSVMQLPEFFGLPGLHAAHPSETSRERTLGSSRNQKTRDCPHWGKGPFGKRFFHFCWPNDSRASAQNRQHFVVNFSVCADELPE